MVRVSLTPSCYLAVTFIGVHLAAGVILIPLEIPFVTKLALASAVAASLAHSLWRHAFLRSRTALIAIELGDEGDRAAVQMRDGIWREGRVLDTTYVSPLLTVLNLRLHERKYARHILIAPDSTDHDDSRRLRVWLRWGYRNDA